MLKPQHLHWPLPDTDPSSLMVKILGVRPPKSWRSSQCARKYRAKNWLKMSQSAPDYWSGVQSLDWLKGHLKETILSFLKCLPLIMRNSCNFSLNPYDSMCFFFWARGLPKTTCTVLRCVRCIFCATTRVPETIHAHCERCWTHPPNGLNSTHQQ